MNMFTINYQYAYSLDIILVKIIKHNFTSRQLSLHVDSWQYRETITAEHSYHNDFALLFAWLAVDISWF